MENNSYRKKRPDVSGAVAGSENSPFDSLLREGSMQFLSEYLIKHAERYDTFSGGIGGTPYRIRVNDLTPEDSKSIVLGSVNNPDLAMGQIYLEFPDGMAPNILTSRGSDLDRMVEDSNSVTLYLSEEQKNIKLKKPNVYCIQSSA